MTIRGKPNVSAFLEGSGEKAAPALSKKETPLIVKAVAGEKATERRQKLVQLPVKMLLSLKRRAIDETEKSGERVTETDIIERALEIYLYR